MGIILYSTNCPKCNVIKKKLDQLEIEYTLIDDIDTVNKFADDHNLHEAPLLVIDDQIFNFKEAIKYLSKGV